MTQPMPPLPSGPHSFNPWWPKRSTPKVLTTLFSGQDHYSQSPLAPPKPASSTTHIPTLKKLFVMDHFTRRLLIVVYMWCLQSMKLDLSRLPVMIVRCTELLWLCRRQQRLLQRQPHNTQYNSQNSTARNASSASQRFFNTKYCERASVM